MPVKKPIPKSKDFQGLEDEIRMLRQLLRKVAVQAEEVQELAGLLKVGETVGKGDTRLAVLLKAQRALGEGQAFSQTLDQELAEVLQEMKTAGHLL